MSAVGYKRLSDKDQSNNSLNNQEVGIIDYCRNNNLELEKIFTDNGKSAFTFDRPEWIKLEEYIKKNKRVKYLIVYHLDRFSRANLMDALIKLHEIEVKLKVKVLTVTDPVNMDSNDLGVQLMRTINLLFSNNERNRIQDRTKDGIYRSLASGRYCNMAQIGYKNGRDEQNKPLLVIDKEKAKYIRKVFKLFNEGMKIEAIRKEVPELKLKGNSAIQRILSNPVYAGLIELPAYKGKPAMEVNAIHEPIIGKYEYYAAKNKLNRRIVIQPSEDVWLRGILHCHCGRLMTAGNSRSHTGKYYWYYKCQEHQINFPAKKLHAQFKEILDELTFSDKSINFIREKLLQSINEHQSKKGGNIMRLKLALSKVQKKIEETQTRYLLNPDIDPKIYSKVITELKEEESKIEINITKATTDTGTLVGLLNDLLPSLKNLSKVFFNFPVHQQQLFINTVFSRPLSYFEEIYRTPNIYPVFADKVLILKEKRLLEIEQPLGFLAESAEGTRDGSGIELFESLYRVMIA
jgi:DNA invertase Pin-like site-specific DNA recombinase